MSLMMPRVTVVSSVGAGAGLMVRLVVTSLELGWSVTGVSWSEVTGAVSRNVLIFLSFHTTWRGVRGTTVTVWREAQK